MDPLIPSDTRRGTRSGSRARGLAHAFHHTVRVLFEVAAVLVLLAGLVHLRLAEGPLHLPAAARLTQDLFNGQAPTVRVEIGDAILTRATGGVPGGLQFVDVRVRTAEGTLLFVIPRIATHFDLAELVRGRLRPREIRIIGPRARLVRDTDGRFAFGLGADVTPTGEGLNEGADAQYAAVRRILDSLAGDAPPIPELSRLERIAILGADFTFENRMTGRSLSARGSTLTVTRTETGLRGELRIDATGPRGAGPQIDLVAERRRGTGGAVRVTARFNDLRPDYAAEELPQLAWLRLFEAPLDGQLRLTIYPDARIEQLQGELRAGPGRLLAVNEHGEPFDRVEIAFAYVPDLARTQIKRLSLKSSQLALEATGFADLDRAADGTPRGVRGQLTLVEARIGIPALFADPLVFDGGQVSAAVTFDPLEVRVTDAYLRAGALVVDASATAAPRGEGWDVLVRAAGRQGTVADLVRFWPLPAARNARKWVATNIHRGRIDRFLAQLRFAAGVPELELDFSYSGLESSYLKDMTPITGARGRGTLTLDRFEMLLDEGEVRVRQGAPVRLDRSVMVIPDLHAKPAVGEIALRARGETASILTLIDEPPLRLVRKLDIDPASVAGTAEVEASLSIPLIGHLRLAQVGVDADARLAEVRLPFRLPYGPMLDVAGDRARVRASTRRMIVEGPLRLNGVATDLRWEERFGEGRNNRSIHITGAVTPGFLDQIALGTPYFTGGTAPARLTLEQRGGPGIRFDLSADLGPARLSVREFGWEKPPGPGGRLEASGTIAKGVEAEHFTLDTDELKAEGRMAFDGSGRIETAELGRLRFKDLADISLGLSRRGEAFLLDVGGRFLDLAMFETPRSGEGTGTGVPPPPPVSVSYRLERVAVAPPTLVAEPGSGTFERAPDGTASGRLVGRLRGRVPFVADYERRPGEPSRIVVTSDDAGAFLATAGLFPSAQGGSLRIEARMEHEGDEAIRGVVIVRDVRVQSAGTFRSILAEGGVKEAAEAAEKGGLYFDLAKVRFVYRKGVIEVERASARGNMLAITAEGEVDENARRVALAGVISPLYSLTGAISKVPLLGDILSGGKNEGILAMTFSLEGPLDDPQFSVNPLTLLTPGILRKIFTGKQTAPSERFLEGLGRDETN